MQGGASGAIIVDGIENVQPAVAGLPERVLLIRDQTTIPGAPTPGGTVPSWDVSLNYVPISYPQFTPAVIQMKPEQQSCGVSQTPRPTRSSIYNCNTTA